jgi:cytochrome c-type biogenesis protein
MNHLKRHMVLIEKLMGALLVFVGTAMLFGLFSQFSFWLLETFPALTVLG